MNETKENKMLLFWLSTFVLLMVIIWVPIFIFDIGNDNVEYKYEQITVCSGDTFWNYYNNGYYDDVSYGEALYEFKKDNEKTKSGLVAGETIVLRKVIK